MRLFLVVLLVAGKIITACSGQDASARAVITLPDPQPYPAVA